MPSGNVTVPLLAMFKPPCHPRLLQMLSVDALHYGKFRTDRTLQHVDSLPQLGCVHTKSSLAILSEDRWCCGSATDQAVLGPETMAQWPLSKSMTAVGPSA